MSYSAVTRAKDKVCLTCLVQHYLPAQKLSLSAAGQWEWGPCPAVPTASASPELAHGKCL